MGSETQHSLPGAFQQVGAGWRACRANTADGGNAHKQDFGGNEGFSAMARRIYQYSFKSIADGAILRHNFVPYGKFRHLEDRLRPSAGRRRRTSGLVFGFAFASVFCGVARISARSICRLCRERAGGILSDEKKRKIMLPFTRLFMVATKE